MSQGTARIFRQIVEINDKIQQTEESIAGTRGALQDALRVVLPMLKDQQKLLLEIANELTSIDAATMRLKQ